MFELSQIVNTVLLFLTVGAWVIGIPSFIYFILGLLSYVIYIFSEDAEIEKKSLGAISTRFPQMKLFGIITVLCLTWIITSFLV